MTDGNEAGHCFNHPNPDLWFYDTVGDAQERRYNILKAVEAIETCQGCPLMEQCLKTGMEPINVEDGTYGGSIWGGRTTYERVKLIRMKPGMGRFRITTMRVEESFNQQLRKELSVRMVRR